MTSDTDCVDKHRMLQGTTATASGYKRCPDCRVCFCLGLRRGSAISGMAQHWAWTGFHSVAMKKPVPVFNWC